MTTKLDPIRDRYFSPLETADEYSVRLFYATAVVSLAVPLIDSRTYPRAYTVVQTAFAALAIGSFMLDLAKRLYWGPRAAEKRIADFTSSAFTVNLTADRTRGYYNNVETEPIRRAGLQLLENALFTKEIARLMSRRRRVVVAIYAVLWIAAMLNRSTPFDLVVVGSQALFSQEIISALVRLEWLRAKTEAIFDAMFRYLSITTTSGTAFAASIVESIASYESHKATSGITLSSKVFNANNARLSVQWNRMRASLGA